MTPPLFAVSPGLLIVGAALIAVPLGLLLWLAFGRLPRRQRAYRRAQRLLHQGDWEGALAAGREILGLGRLSPLWEGRLGNLQGEGHHVAGDAALKEKRYEDALRHYVTAAQLLKLTEGEFRAKVVEGMVAEVHRLFAAGPSHNEAAQHLLARTLSLQPSCAAASFWQGLCHVRDGRLDLAAAALAKAHEDGGKAVLDPPLYLGMLQLRQGRPQEALRSLAEANRIDSACPFVPLHMGLALVAAEGDGGLAVRALQRALGNRGLAPWAKAPQRAWVDGMPENRSYVRRLAVKYPYACPLLGSELTPLVLQGQFALAQAHYRLGHFAEAADVFGRLLQDAPPSAPVLRGLGLALARLERYDEAYKHLRIALEMDPQDHRVAGYLALCGALGKPTQDEDRPRNVAWAVRQLTQYEVYGDPEWAGLCGRVFAEARALGMAVAAGDQVRLCDVLASVFATDPQAAAAYDHLAATAPEALRPEHAWVYCRAAYEHGLAGRRDLEMFGRTFQDAEAAQTFYRQRGWDFGAVEYAYLERSARARPGRFPVELGPDYAGRGPGLLLERSRRQEAAGDRDGALATAGVLLALAPTNVLAHDRLAQVCYQRGDLDRAAALLAGWHRLEPTNPLPLVRRAVIEQQRGNPSGRADALRQALERARGPLRAGVAFLGARLALGSALAATTDNTDDTDQKDSSVSSVLSVVRAREVEDLLQECLKEEPGHTGALWVLASLRSVSGDRDGLAALAPALSRPEVADARFHYMAAVAHLEARDHGQALEACRRAWGEPSLTVECRYLMGWAHLHLGEEAAAVREWEVVARTPDSPSAPYAQALLGRIRFGQGNYESAIPWWSGLDPPKRNAWGLDEPLRGTVFLAGLLALDEGRFGRAAERFGEAGRLGLRDRRVGPLLTLALVKAGQARLYAVNGQAADSLPQGVALAPQGNALG
jgi:tetratricopeptide (TPR) repeat protein